MTTRSNDVRRWSTLVNVIVIRPRENETSETALLLSPEMSFQLGFYGLLDFVQLGLVVDVPITVLLGVYQGTVNLHLQNAKGEVPLSF